VIYFKKEKLELANPKDLAKDGNCAHDMSISHNISQTSIQNEVDYTDNFGYSGELAGGLTPNDKFLRFIHYSTNQE